MAPTADMTTVSRFFHPTARTNLPGRLPPLDLAELPSRAESPVLAAVRRLYYQPGPYVSINMTVHSGTGPAADSTHRRWEAIDNELQQRKTSPLVIEEIAQRVLSKPPAWAASLSVLAASDGTVVAGHGPEPFFADMVVVDTLPYVVPLLAWSQRRGPHLIMTEHDLVDVGAAVDELPSSLSSLSRPNEEDGPTHLVLLGQPAATRPVAEMIASASPRKFEVVAETRLLDAAELGGHRTRTANSPGNSIEPAVVHQTVAHLPGTDGDAVTVQRVLERLSKGDVDVVVLTSDDTLDQRRVWIGPEATDLSLHPRRGLDHQARLVDAVARAALVNGVDLVIQAVSDEPDTRFVA